MNAATAATTEQEPRRRRAIGAFLTLALSLATIAVSATGAVFTDADSHEGNTFATGTVDLADFDPGQTFDVTNMAPGDTATQAVTVTNGGSLELRYATTSTSTDSDTVYPLSAQLDLWVWEESAAADGCNATPAEAGSHVYGPGDLGSTTGLDLFGDATQGEHPGDRVLGAGDHEVLCFHVALPESTGNDYQGSSTTATFEFLAEQTANN